MIQMLQLLNFQKQARLFVAALNLPVFTNLE